MTHVATEMISGYDCIFLVKQPQNECQLIGILDSIYATSICCHRGRHRCNAVIHLCLYPTRGLCVTADLNICVRPSEKRLRISGLIFSDRFFSHHFSFRFSFIYFLIKCSSEIASSKNKCSKNAFLFRKLGFVVIVRTLLFIFHTIRPEPDQK